MCPHVIVCNCKWMETYIEWNFGTQEYCQWKNENRQKPKISNEIHIIHRYRKKTLWPLAICNLIFTWAASSLCSSKKNLVLWVMSWSPVVFQVLYVTAESLRSLQGSRTTLLAWVPTRWVVPNVRFLQELPQNLQHVPTGKGASRFIRLTCNWIKIPEQQIRLGPMFIGHWCGCVFVWCQSLPSNKKFFVVAGHQVKVRRIPNRKSTKNECKGSPYGTRLQICPLYIFGKKHRWYLWI